MTAHPWAHAGTVTYGTRVYNVWSFTHREGYTGYQLTAPTVPADRPPSGDGHYTSMEGLLSRFAGPVKFVPDPPAGSAAAAVEAYHHGWLDPVTE